MNIKKICDKNFLLFLNTGKSNMQFPGLNAPLSNKEIERSHRTNFLAKSDKNRQPKLDSTLRGWSGTSWPGRYAGSPESPNKGNFHPL